LEKKDLLDFLVTRAFLEYVVSLEKKVTKVPRVLLVIKD
jgi:hypothetical protein